MDRMPNNVYFQNRAPFRTDRIVEFDRLQSFTDVFSQVFIAVIVELGKHAANGIRLQNEGPGEIRTYLQVRTEAVASPS